MGSGRPVVLIHSGLGDGSLWDRMLRFVPVGVRAVPLDLPVIGYPSPPTSFSEIEAQLIRYVETTFPAGDVALVGHSAGGWLVARVLRALEPRLRSAVIVAGVSQLSSEEAAAYRDLARSIDAGVLSQEAFVSDIATRALGKAATPELMGELTTMLHEYTPERLGQALRLIAELDTPAGAAGRYETACTVVHAEHDAIVSVTQAQALAGLGPSTLELWPGDCHMLPLSEPERLARVAFS